MSGQDFTYPEVGATWDAELPAGYRHLRVRTFVGTGPAAMRNASELGWDGGDDWDFTSAVEDDPQFLYDLYDGAVRRSRERFAAYLADGDCARAVESAVGETHANARRLLCDLIEEYGRHTGHADLLREAADGRVGEDPPDGWQPVGSGGRG